LVVTLKRSNALSRPHEPQHMSLSAAVGNIGAVQVSGGSRSPRGNLKPDSNSVTGNATCPPSTLAKTKSCTLASTSTAAPLGASASRPLPPLPTTATWNRVGIVKDEIVSGVQKQYATGTPHADTMGTGHACVLRKSDLPSGAPPHNRLQGLSPMPDESSSSRADPQSNLDQLFEAVIEAWGGAGTEVNRLHQLSKLSSSGEALNRNSRSPNRAGDCRRPPQRFIPSGRSFEPLRSPSPSVSSQPAYLLQESPLVKSPLARGRVWEAVQKFEGNIVSS
jgi:hypothetical protein